MLGGDQFNQEPGAPQPASRRAPAILDDCRAVPVTDATDFAQCLAPTGPSCIHRLIFSRFRYCVHPRREEIIARTLAAGSPPDD